MADTKALPVVSSDRSLHNRVVDHLKRLPRAPRPKIGVLSYTRYPGPDERWRKYTGMHTLNDKDLARFINWWQEQRAAGREIHIKDLSSGVFLTLVDGNHTAIGMGRNPIIAMESVLESIKRATRFGRKPDASDE